MTDPIVVLVAADGLPSPTLPDAEGHRIRFRKDQAEVLYQYLTVWVKK